MSRFSTALSYGVIVSLLSGLTVWITASYPLHGAPQLADNLPENVSVQGAELLSGGPPDFPMAARRANVEGPVELEATLADNGEVSDARVIAGLAELRKAALEAVLNWKFRPGPRLARIIVTFRADAPPAGLDVTKIFIAQSVQGELGKTLRARLHPFEGQPYTDEIHAAVRSVSPRLRVRVERNPFGAVNETTVFIGPSLAKPTAAAAPMPQLITKVDPVYPPLARQARIQGRVRFQIAIDRSGSVSSIRLVSGHPLLVSAAQDAVRQYRYRIAMVDGQPSELNMTVDVTFTL